MNEAQAPVAQSPATELTDALSAPSEAMPSLRIDDQLPESPVAQARALRESVAPIIVLASWIVPGLGHLILGRWSRAFTFFVAVGGLALAGYAMRGEVFTPYSGDPFGTLGFLADAGSGIFYLLGHSIEIAGPDVSRATGDYGTRFIAAAGIVNVLGILDAYGIVRRRRS